MGVAVADFSFNYKLMKPEQASPPDNTSRGNTIWTQRAISFQLPPSFTSPNPQSTFTACRKRHSKSSYLFAMWLADVVLTPPTITLPRITPPTITLPRITLLRITLPRITLLRITLLRITLPRITLLRLTLPRITLPTITGTGSVRAVLLLVVAFGSVAIGIVTFVGVAFGSVAIGIVAIGVVVVEIVVVRIVAVRRIRRDAAG